MCFHLAKVGRPSQGGGYTKHIIKRFLFYNIHALSDSWKKNIMNSFVRVRTVNPTIGYRVHIEFTDGTKKR